MRLAYVYHHEAHAVAEAAVQLVQPRGGAVRHGAGAGTEDQQRRCGRGEIAGSEPASLHGREVERRNAVAWTGVVLVEMEIPHYDWQSQTFEAVAVSCVFEGFSSRLP